MNQEPKNWLSIALLLAGIAHFGILIASANVPFALNWRKTLQPLPKLIRQLFWVYGCFIVLTILSFGILTLVHSSTLSEGTPLSRTVSGVIAIFWFARLLVQFFVFDAKPFLTNRFYKVGYHCLTLVFIFLTLVYSWAALFPDLFL